MKRMLLIFIILFSFFPCYCTDEGDSINKRSIPIVDNPEDPPEEDPEEEKIMKAIFFYDNSLVALNDDFSLTKLKDANNVEKAGEFFLVDSIAQNVDETITWNINSPAKQATWYGDKLFYLGQDNKIYMCEIEAASQLIASNQFTHLVSLQESGIMNDFTFIKPDGTIEAVDYACTKYEQIFKLTKTGDFWHQHMFKENAWINVGNSLYSDFANCHALILPDKTIFTKGSTLEGDVLTQPTYNAVIARYVNGNAFMKYIQPGAVREIFKPIDNIGNIAYFINSYDGCLYKYSISEDILTQWLNITTGIENDNPNEAEDLFNSLSCIIVDNFIIYFQDDKIKRLNVDTGVSEDLANATSLKAWVL